MEITTVMRAAKFHCGHSKRKMMSEVFSKWQGILHCKFII
jgi:hypothetical protein